MFSLLWGVDHVEKKIHFWSMKFEIDQLCSSDRAWCTWLWPGKWQDIVSILRTDLQSRNLTLSHTNVSAQPSTLRCLSKRERLNNVKLSEEPVTYIPCIYVGVDPIFIVLNALTIMVPARTVHLILVCPYK